MKKVFLLFAVLFSLVSFTSCSNSSNVGDIVCDYGSVLCDVSTTLCRDVPGVPDQVCNYLDLACYNLNTICELRDSTGSVKYQQALNNIQFITEKLKTWQAAQSK